MPTRRTVVEPLEAIPELWTDNDEGTNSDVSSIAIRTSNGCIEGLVPSLATSVLLPGEAWWQGQRIRVRTPQLLAIAGLTRPPSGQVAWVSVAASYAVERFGEVTDSDGRTHDQVTRDSATISLLRGDNAANQAAAVRPPIPDGSIILCDILLDHDTAVSGLSGSDLRRPKCPHDALADRLALLEAWRQSTEAVPNAPAAPTLTSTAGFQVTSTWLNPGVRSSGPAITEYWHQWRRAGAQWQSENIVILGPGLSHTFSVPDATSDIETRVAGVNTNGPGPWSPAGRIAAGDIMGDAPLTTSRYEAAGVQRLTWLYRATGRARVTLQGGQGGGGTDGTVGSAGADASQVMGWSVDYQRTSGLNRNVGCHATLALARQAAQADPDYQVELRNFRCTIWVDGAAGASGTPGVAGTAGGQSSATVAARSLSATSAGGPGGAAGVAGQGGAGGTGPNGMGQAAPALGSPGGPTRGAAGTQGTLRSVIFENLRFGDVIEITVGAGGAGSPAGSAGSVVVEPLPAGDIDPPLTERRFAAAGAQVFDWPYRLTDRMRITTRGAMGGGGTDGTAGTAGGDAIAGAVMWGFSCSGYRSPASYASRDDAVRAAQTASQCSGRASTPYSEQMWSPGAAGSPGTGGAAGTAGGQSSVTVATRSIAQSSAGGAGGAAGTAGTGGAAGTGPNGQGGAAPGFGAAGGPTRGGAGAAGAEQVAVVTGLRHGDRISIVVGAGGSGDPVGADGLVLLEPLPPA